MNFLSATTFQVLFATFSAVMLHHAEAEEAVIGTPLQGRSESRFDGVVGYLATAMPIRTALDGDPTFLEWVDTQRIATLNALAHQDVDVPGLVRRLNLRHELGSNPLFQVTFNMYDDPEVLLDLPGVSATRLQMGKTTALFDLTFEIRKRADGAFDGFVNYSTDLYRRSSAERLVRSYVDVLELALQEPERRLRSILTEAIPARALRLSERSMIENFSDSVSRYGDRPAAIDAVGSMSYRDLDAVAERVASRLLGERRALAGEIVGICLPRSIDLVVSELAIVKSGGVYLPLDPDDPASRRNFIVEDAAISTVVTVRRYAGLFDDPELRVVLLDPETPLDASEAIRPARLPVSPESGAYVMYTSGSTGAPKGVEVPHRGVGALAEGLEVLDLGPSDTMLLFAHPCFDASTFEIWVALANGASIAVHPPGRLDLEELRETICRFGVTAMFLTPALMNVVADTDPTILDGVRVLVVGGEAMSLRHARRLMEVLPGIRIFNGYGPTETTTFATLFEVPRGRSLDGDYVPIGRPLARAEIYIVDDDLEPVATGEVGELLIGGAGVSIGYLNRPGLTAERFVPEAAGKRGTGSGSRLYRTGDLVRAQGDGVLEFVGRTDDQVKIRGFRVEPGEVRAVLLRHPEVRDAFVSVVRDEKESALVAYVSTRETGCIDDVRARLAEDLPSYMLPASFVEVDELPKNAVGKVDRDALPKPVPSTSAPLVDLPGSTAEWVGVEEIVHDVWCEVLGVNALSPEDDFFAIGGNSLRAAEIAAMLRDRVGKRVPLRVVFENPTISTQARAIDSLGMEG